MVTHHPKDTVGGVMKRIASTALIACGVLAAATFGVVPAQAIARDSCLSGSWRMSRAAATAYMNRILPASGGVSLHATSGSIKAIFSGGNVTVGGDDFTLAGTGPDGSPVSATTTWETQAPYRTSRGQLITGAGSGVFHFGDMQMTVNGTTINVPIPDQTVNTDGGRSPYTCNAHTLHWAVRLPSGESVQSTFRR